MLAAKFELGFYTCRRWNDWQPAGFGLPRWPCRNSLRHSTLRPARQSGQVSLLYLFVRLITVVPFSETAPNFDVSVQGFTPFFDCIPLMRGHTARRVSGVLVQEFSSHETLEVGRLQRISTTGGEWRRLKLWWRTTRNSYCSQKGSAVEAFDFRCVGRSMRQNSWANRQN